MNIKQLVLELIHNYPKTYSQQLDKQANLQELKTTILNVTKFLDLYNDLNILISNATRCWYIINNVLDISLINRCKNCGKYLIKNHIITDNLNLSRENSDFCNKTCKNEFFQAKKLKKYNDYLNTLSEQNIKFWTLRGYSYHDAAMKTREYKPQYIEYWIAHDYDYKEAKQKCNNYKNPIKEEYWLLRGYSIELTKIEIANEQYKRNSKHKKKKEYWLELGYSEEDAIKLSKYEYCILNPTTVLYWTSRGYSELEAHILIRKNKKLCKEYWIDKGYSELEAIQFAHKYALQKIKNSKEYWIAKGYSEKDAIKLAKENCIGINAAHEVFTKALNRLCKEYWIAKGYSEKDAIKLAKEANRLTTKNIPYEVRSAAVKKARASFSPERKNELSNNQSKIMKKKNKTHSPIFKEYWIDKGYSEDDAIQKVIETRYVNNENLSKASKIELKFFNELMQFLNIKIILLHWVTINNKVFCQDGRYENIVFEFNGTNFHMDPRIYTENDKNPVGKTFNEVKTCDRLKLDYYRTKNYIIIEIWQNDYLHNKAVLFSIIKTIIQNRISYSNGYYWSSLDLK